MVFYGEKLIYFHKKNRFRVEKMSKKIDYDLNECEVCGRRKKLYFNEYTEEWMCESCLSVDLDSRGN